MKQKAKGIERLFRLIGSNPQYDYRYGMYTTEESPDCNFRIVFSEYSQFFRMGIPPKLIVCADGVVYDPFHGHQDYDDSKTSWFFPINDEMMEKFCDAKHIDSIVIQHRDETILDLHYYEPEVWGAFFQASWSECVEEVLDSRELEEFYIQRYLAAIRHNTKF